MASACIGDRWHAPEGLTGEAAMGGDLRWGVVGTMDEPAPLILSWAAHHMWLGAAEVHIYLDRPNPEVSDTLRDMPRVFVTDCDADFWAATVRGIRPPRHTARQKSNATQVYRTRPLDWVLHCDADEFLTPGDIASELSASTALTLRIANVERVRRGPEDGIFAGTFRGPQREPGLSDAVYDRWAPFLAHGMAGYQGGKEIVRTGEAFAMGVHAPVDVSTGRFRDQPYTALDATRILHFDGLTPLHVLIKLLKRAHEPVFKPPRKYGPQRERQFGFARRQAQRPRRLQKMLDGVFGLTAEQALALRDSHHEMAFDPRPALAAIGLSPDLSSAAFDAELRTREAELIERAGLKY